MIRKFLSITIACLLSATVFAQTEKEYTETLRKMFEVSGTEESYKTVIEQMFKMYKLNYTEVDAEIWDDLHKEFAKTSLNDLTEMLAPVYEKYMTKEDLEQVIAFYESPVGRKFARNTPFIMEESMQVGQEWGLKIGQEFEEKMRARGY
jgi:hypothetical protein